MAWHTSWNAKQHENLLAFSDQWQAFVRGRISEDFRLLQRVGTAGTVEQLVGIYGKFWQQAVEDYAREYAAITKLAGVGIMPDKCSYLSSATMPWSRRHRTCQRRRDHPCTLAIIVPAGCAGYRAESLMTGRTRPAGACARLRMA